MSDAAPNPTAKATDFALTDQAGHEWRLSDALATSAVLLVFYRGDW